MQAVLMLAGALVSPLLGLALLLWLAHLEDTLPQDVQRTRRKPAPAPILAIPVRAAESMQVVVPGQRDPVGAQAFGRPVHVAPGPQPGLREGSRSEAVSLGGSTNR